MLPRVLEPEVMDSRAEAVDYDAMDHREVNRVFLDDFLELLRSSAALPEGRPLKALDVGCGTAQIPIELCRRPLDCRVIGIDLAAAMLAVGEENVREAGLEGCIALERVDAKRLPYEDGRFDAVISNSIVHHIPEPKTVMAEMLRVLKPGGVLLVRDLLRPEDVETVDRLVETYAGEENAHQRQMFRDSLCAALRLEEVRAMLAELGRPEDWAEQTSDRHWTVRGIA